MALPKRAGSQGAHNPQQHPRQSPFHDILLIRDEFVPRQNGPRVERFAIDKTTGTYRNDPGTSKVPLRPDAEVYRPTINMGRFGARSPDDPSRGPALATLPLHPSPVASSATTCYLINPGNLNHVTAWTSEEWNDPPGGHDSPGRIDNDHFSLLVATPAGKVYYLEKKATAAKTVNYDDGNITFREVPLNGEVEIWAQLRGGCVVGRALYEKAPGASRKERVIPLVNIESLTPRSPGAGNAEDVNFAEATHAV